MALVLTHRYNWMGYEGTESESLNVGFMRAANGESGARYANSKARKEEAADIRMRLRLIQRDLGLLPKEEATAVEGVLEGSQLESDGEYYEQLSLKRSESPENGYDEAGGLFLYPKNPSDDVTQFASRQVTNGVRTLLMARGETFVSYIDGREFISLAELNKHNETQRPLFAEQLDGTGVLIPPHIEFDTTGLEVALEEKNQYRMKLDSVRCLSDPFHVAKIREEERDAEGNPVTNVNPEDGDVTTLQEKLNKAKGSLASARAAYNKEATQSSKRIHSALVAKLEASENINDL